jgi:hypothetical protein
MPNQDRPPDIHVAPDRGTKRLMWAVAVVVVVLLGIGLIYWFTADQQLATTPASPPTETRTPALPKPSPGPATEPALPAPQK